MKRSFALPLFAAAALQAASTALPPFTRDVLPNGVVVYLMPKKDVPMVTFRVVIRGGAEADPEGKAGLGALAADMLTRGTKSKSSEEYARALEFHGATLNTGVNRQTTMLTAEALSSSAGAVLDLLAEALLEPAFRADEFKNLLGRSRDRTRQMKDTAQAVLPNYFDAFLFGAAHPYGRPTTGDEISLGNIQHADLRALHDSLCVGANLTFIAAGDFDAAEMKARIAVKLGALKKGEPYAWKTAARPKPAAGARLLLVDKPDATQTYFEIGQPGISRTHPDRAPVLVVNTLLGGRFTSLLNDALRVNAGLTYGAGSRFDMDRLDGAFHISSYTRTAATVEAIDLALAVLNKLRAEGLTAEQLASTKAYIKGTYPTRTMETASQLSVILGDMETFGLKRGDYDDYFARIDAVTLEQANAALKKYFGSESFSFTLFGNAAAIRDAVKKFAPGVVEVQATTPGYPTH